LLWYKKIKNSYGVAPPKSSLPTNYPQAGPGFSLQVLTKLRFTSLGSGLFASIPNALVSSLKIIFFIILQLVSSLKIIPFHYPAIGFQIKNYSFSLSCKWFPV